MNKKKEVDQLNQNISKSTLEKLKQKSEKAENCIKAIRYSVLKIQEQNKLEEFEKRKLLKQNQ